MRKRLTRLARMLHRRVFSPKKLFKGECWDYGDFGAEDIGALIEEHARDYYTVGSTDTR